MAEKSKEEYVERGQWLRAAVMGANDGLVSTASLMMGVGALKAQARAMLVAGVAALVAGTLSMAISEYVSVATQRDVHVAARRRTAAAAARGVPCGHELHVDVDVDVESHGEVADGGDPPPSPWKAAVASAVSFAAGALVPLLTGGFVVPYVARVTAMAATCTVALAAFGGVGAFYGGASAPLGSVRVVMGGWLAMLTTFGALKLFGKVTAAA